MLVYDLFINVWESLAISYFVGYYFDLEQKKKHGLIMGITMATTTTISNYFNRIDNVLVFLAVFMLWFSVYYFKKSSSFYILFICSVAMAIMLCCNIMVLFIASLLFDTSAMEIVFHMDAIGYVITTCISKIMFTLILYSWYKNKRPIPIGIKFTRWWLLLVIILSLLMLFLLMSEIIMLEQFTVQRAYYALILLIIMIVSTALLFYRIHQEYENTMLLNMKMQAMENREKNYHLISMANKDLERNMHTSKYFLLRLKHRLAIEDIQGAQQVVDERLEKEVSSYQMITTGNYYFDYHMNYHFRKYNIKKNTIKMTMLMGPCEVVERKEFAELCCQIISYIGQNKQSEYSAFEMRQLEQFIQIKVVLLASKKEKMMAKKWQDNIQKLLHIMDFEYDISSDNTIISVHFLIAMDTLG